MHSETITLEGHIIDSRALSETLDDIITFGGDFEVLEVHIGRRKHDRSHARIEVYAETPEKLAQLIGQVTKRGAFVESPTDCELVDADMNGAFPDDFYCTTNQPTFVRHAGQWREVSDLEMDCGIWYDPNADQFRCIPMEKVRRGHRVVCGTRGIHIEPIERHLERGTFQYLATEIATEKPKGAILRHCAQLILDTKASGKRVLLVGGASIVHTDSAQFVVQMIEDGTLHGLIASNALAVHDIELALYGTSLGVYVEKAALADTGHEHPLRAINSIRRAGGIKAAVKAGLLDSGILHACVKHNVEFCLLGSVRDEAPLPETIADTVVAQDHIREAIRDVGFVLMVASRTLSISTAYILPAATPVVCVDLNPSVLNRIRDRGTFQTIGIVTDAESFFRELLEEVEKLKAKRAGG